MHVAGCIFNRRVAWLSAKLQLCFANRQAIDVGFSYRLADILFLDLPSATMKFPTSSGTRLASNFPSSSGTRLRVAFPAERGRSLRHFRRWSCNAPTLFSFFLKHQLGAAEEDRAEKLTRRVNDVKACVKSTYQNTYTHTRIDSHSGSTDRASMSASSGSTTPSYSASVQAQAPEMERPAPSSRDRNLGQETTPTPTTPTSVQHQLGQARPNGERRRQQEPQWDAPDDDEGLWTLVSEKKPAEKKAVLYLGKLKGE